MTLDIAFGTTGWWRYELVCADDSCTGSAGESGSDDTGSDDTGSDDTNSDNTGSDNVAPTDNDNELLSGDWILSPAGSLGVGPSQGNISWWSTDEAEVVTRACLYDDVFSFNSDGSFANVMGGDTWLEGWQGAEGCGAQFRHLTVPTLRHIPTMLPQLR